MKKLIEVALPLDDINKAAIREKSIRHGHPSTLHLWWARRPMAAARAILFAQLVNDPGGSRGYGAYKGQSKKDAHKERERLFQIIRDLVKWENTNNDYVLEQARDEILKSWKESCEISGDDPDILPDFFDPFAGGGTIPLEAQRLGLNVHASDLNPVALMINKAIIEIPNKFKNKKPIGPLLKNHKKKKSLTITEWNGVNGLAEDVRRYGAWLKKEAYKKIGHFYPKITINGNNRTTDANVIAWLWTRTVRSPSPAYKDVFVPLVRSFIISTKKNNKVWVELNINHDSKKYEFIVHNDNNAPPNAAQGTRANKKATFRCVFSDALITADYIRNEGKAGQLKRKLMAIVVEDVGRGQVFFSPNSKAEIIANNIEINKAPNSKLPDNPRWFAPPLYGLKTHGDLFSPRQLLALNTFSELISETRKKVIEDAEKQGWQDTGKSLYDGGNGSAAYGDAISLYLAFAVSRSSNYWSSFTPWGGSFIVQTFGRQAIPMVWDYAEANPFSNSTGSWLGALDWISRCLDTVIPNTYSIGRVSQQNASTLKIPDNFSPIISTDPPYYDNIGYADLSDYFYVWLRRSLKDIYPDLFTTLLTPKDEELIASPVRHGGKDKADSFFMENMSKAIRDISRISHPGFPVTIYYAFKQSETNIKGTVSKGWEAFLEAVIRSGFTIVGTWPMRTERDQGLKTGSNVLASSIILVCRKRPSETSSISRKKFLRKLEEALPEALEDIIGGKEGASPIAPVDLAQAAIGPGMAVFSKYTAVLEADGSPMTVNTALILINKAIDEYFTQAESDMGPDTRFCVDWFQQYGFKQGPFGEADVLARAKGTTVDGVQSAGVIESGGGKVRLFKVDEYPSDWDPTKDTRLPIWEACHHLCRGLQESEMTAGALLAKMPEKTEPIRQLAYRLYTLCERKGWAEEARNYNDLITSWHAIVEASHGAGRSREQQKLFE